MKNCWAQYLIWLVFAVLGTGSALSACGQKGDLYHPTETTISSSLSGDPSANEQFSTKKSLHNEPF